MALFYQDTWLPPFSRLLDQPGVLNFTADYLLELTGRFIDWNLCGALLFSWWPTSSSASGCA